MYFRGKAFFFAYLIGWLCFSPACRHSDVPSPTHPKKPLPTSFVFESWRPAAASYNAPGPHEFDPPKSEFLTSRGPQTSSSPTIASLRVRTFRHQVLRLLEQTTLEAGRKPIAADGRLDAVAHDLARLMPTQGTLPYAAIAFATSYHGVIEPTPAVVALWFRRTGQPRLAQGAIDRLRRLIQSESFARIGIGMVDRDPQRTAAVIVLLRSYIKTNPIARSLTVGEDARLWAKILSPYRRAYALVTDPFGKTVRIGRAARSGLSATIRCRQSEGKYQVEVMAEDERGPAVLANFPIWCGSTPPESYAVPWTEQELPADAQQAERQLFELLNADRRAAGLHALMASAKVAKVARGHSEAMARSGKVAHTSQATGTAADRLKAAGLRAPVVRENLARSTGVAEAHRGLMSSPSHRANILSPDVSQVGIGVAFREEAAGNREIFVTQLLTFVPPPIDEVTANEQVTAMIKKETGLRPHGVLESLAQEHARGIARAKTKAQRRAVSNLLRKRSEMFDRTRIVVSTVVRLGDFKGRSLNRKADMTHFGVGVAQGPHVDLGPNAIHIVVVLGHRT